MKILNIFNFSFIFILSYINIAHAYLDPGASSMLLQVIIAAGVGAMAYFRTIMAKIKSIFTKIKPKDKGKTK